MEELPPKNDSLHSLMRLSLPARCPKYCVFAYALNRDIINNGVLDDLYGVIFYLGSYSDYEAAKNRAREIIEITKHPGVIVCTHGVPVPLTDIKDTNRIEQVKLDDNGKLIELENQQFRKEKEIYEKQAKLKKSMSLEIADEMDPDHIEYFKRQCYLAIQTRSMYEYHKAKADEALKSYEQYKSLLLACYIKHPDYEERWLPYLKEKLEARGEDKLYDTISNEYPKIRTELFNK